MSSLNKNCLIIKTFYLLIEIQINAHFIEFQYIVRVTGMITNVPLVMVFASAYLKTFTIVLSLTEQHLAIEYLALVPIYLCFALKYKLNIKLVEYYIIS